MDKVRRHSGNHFGRGTGKAQDEEGGEPLGEGGVGIGLKADGGGVVGVCEGADPDLGDATADTVGVDLERRIERRQPGAVVEELLVLGLGLGDGLEEGDDVAELGREERYVDGGGSFSIFLLLAEGDDLGRFWKEMGEEKTSDLEGRRKAPLEEKAEGFGRILGDERRRRAEEEMEDAMIDRSSKKR